MKSHRVLAVYCVFMITCHIVTQGYIFENFLHDEEDDLNSIYNQNVISGYRVETLGNVLNNYDSSSYTLRPLGEVLRNLGNNGQVRKKRSFFSNINPFGSTSNSEITEKSITTVTKDIKETGETSTTQKNDITIKEPSDISTTEPNDVITNKEEKDVSIKTNSNIATDTADGVSTTMTGDVSTEIVNNGGFYNMMQNNVMHIVDIGKDVKDSMVTAAPYLPMVFKIAVYFIPGMSSYQVLMLSVNIATITSQAILRYSEGESISSVAFDAGTKIAYESMFKRDIGATMGEYATNIYDSFISAIKSRFGHNTETTKITEIDKDGTKTETEINTNIIEIPEMIIKPESGMNIVVTKYHLNNVEMPAATETIVTNNNDENNVAINQTTSMEKSQMMDLEEKYAEMKSYDENSSDTSNGSLSNETDETGESEESEESEENDSSETVEVDQALFEKILEESNSVQPKSIQNMSGEQLVEYLERTEIKLPEPRVNNTQVFEALTNNMDFDDSVTDEQIAKLNQSLNKLTDYYIATTLDKQTQTTPTEN